MTSLVELHDKELVRIVKTDVLDTELSTWEGPRGDEGRLKSAQFDEDYGVLVLDHSRLDHAVLAADSDVILYDSLAELIFGASSLPSLHSRQIRDVMVVGTHIRNCRDFLVTQDKTILAAADALWSRYRCRVLTPEDCLAAIAITPNEKV
jgi:hypothetical protein